MTDQTLTTDTGHHWENWGGNQSFTYAEAVIATTDDDVIEAVRAAESHNTGIRVTGSGHSFTPIVQTDHTLLNISQIAGVTAADSESRRATVRAGTGLANVGAPLWDAGLSLANQGDVDAQTISGAIATGTKGSGLQFGSLSSTVRGVRLVDGRGDIVTITEDDADLLHAAQVSIGMLGVFLDMTLQCAPAYKIQEQNAVLPFDEVDSRWDEFLNGYRHFSFWWLPQQGSSQMYDLGDLPKDHCVVKLLTELPADAPDVEAEPGARTGRAHLIYPDATTDARFHELEYMVPAEHGRAALETVRHLMQTKHDDQISPVQIRWQKADNAYLSAQYERDTVSVSVSGKPGTTYEPFLRELDHELRQFDARPHWGKVHYLTRERAEALYPKYDDFQRIRRQFDPKGIFLNPHLRELFG
ncbi:D-arabinono-1,4-lactone oxidase [Mycolicibacterium sp. 120266]|uniref:D-arabinono-1,4-lactone oxidase n=1 Tax=Mycolicibacterium sp. 120266 TaxID=3090601 RepID=UPI00299D2F04|nr:D-arabinono-1,4-lactone oxidase [Mycolicibacterium sp. 120266]MDX1876148.1 D-arabinono-1,4-lactone oxidase [Mycolicibacterium sp. 120266]